MNLTKFFACVLLATAIAAVSCKGKDSKDSKDTKDEVVQKDLSPKDVFVGDWKITNVTGPEGEQMPDSVKTKAYTTSSMVFTTDGHYTMHILDNSSTGTFSISADGKTVTSTEAGKEPELSEILECTKDKIVMKNTKDQSTMTLTK